MWPARLAVLLSLSLSAAGQAPAAGIVHVRPGAPDTGTGENPANPVGTLSYAAQQVSEGGTIRLAEGSYTGGILVLVTLTLEGDWDPDFSERNLPLVPGRTTITGPGTDRVLTVQGNGIGLVVDGVTITGGDAGSAPVHPGMGGGIGFFGDGALSIVNSTIAFNQGRQNPDPESGHLGGRGGGVYTTGGHLTIHNSTIRRNEATRALPTQPVFDGMAHGGFGGGVFVAYDPRRPNTMVSITNTEIASNTAQFASAGGTGFLNGIPAFGGGIAVMPVAGDFDGDGRVEVTVANSSIRANCARIGEEGEAFGGGLYLASGGVGGGFALFASFDSTDISLNNASFASQGLVVQGNGARGGGIFVAGNGAGGVTLTNSTLSSNVAEALGGNSFGTGGGIAVDSMPVALVGSSITNNVAAQEAQDARGGAIDVIGGPLTIDRCKVHDNTALENPLTGPPFLAADGGGVFHRGTKAADRLRIVNCTFAGNRATNSETGVVQVRGQALFASQVGGGTPPPSSIHQNAFLNTVHGPVLVEAGIFDATTISLSVALSACATNSELSPSATTSSTGWPFPTRARGSPIRGAM